jgi:predicted nucleic acid-binding protein
LIVVDSSVWVAALRGAPRIANELSRLIDEDAVSLVNPVRLELLAGSRAKDAPTLRRLFSAVPTYAPVGSTWKRVEGWIEIATKVGERFAIFDLLIAATAREQRASVWSLDEDFERMADLKFIKLHRPLPRA